MQTKVKLNYLSQLNLKRKSYIVTIYTIFFLFCLSQGNYTIDEHFKILQDFPVDELADLQRDQTLVWSYEGKKKQNYSRKIKNYGQMKTCICQN